MYGGAWAPGGSEPWESLPLEVVVPVVDPLGGSWDTAMLSVNGFYGGSVLMEYAKPLSIPAPRKAYVELPETHNR